MDELIIGKRYWLDNMRDISAEYKRCENVSETENYYFFGNVKGNYIYILDHNGELFFNSDKGFHLIC